MNCQALNIWDRKLNSTSAMSAINEAQSLVKQDDYVEESEEK